MARSVLPLVLLVHCALVRKSHQQTFVKNISSCPYVGHFFQRGTILEDGTYSDCQLCFCNGNSALCWKRENRICDKDHQTENKGSRMRRSPVGLSDIFFRDATREFFDKQAPEQCKPYESSYSVGCPPADWCIGCTVCDCDANGRWDCHVLSFCPENQRRNKMNKQKSILKENIPQTQKPVTTFTPLYSTVKLEEKKSQLLSKNTQSIKTLSRAKPIIRNRKNLTKNLNVKKLYSKKVIGEESTKNVFPTQKSLFKTTKANKTIVADNSAALLAQNIMKRVMLVLHKALNKHLGKLGPNKVVKVVKKRSLIKNSNDEPQRKQNLKSANKKMINYVPIKKSTLKKIPINAMGYISNNNKKRHKRNVFPDLTSTLKTTTNNNDSQSSIPIIISDIWLDDGTKIYYTDKSTRMTSSNPNTIIDNYYTKPQDSSHEQLNINGSNNLYFNERKTSTNDRGDIKEYLTVPSTEYLSNSINEKKSSYNLLVTLRPFFQMSTNKNNPIYTNKTSNIKEFIINRRNNINLTNIVTVTNNIVIPLDNITDKQLETSSALYSDNSHILYVNLANATINTPNDSKLYIYEYTVNESNQSELQALPMINKNETKSILTNYVNIDTVVNNTLNITHNNITNDKILIVDLFNKSTIHCNLNNSLNVSTNNLVNKSKIFAMNVRKQLNNKTNKIQSILPKMINNIGDNYMDIDDNNLGYLRVANLMSLKYLKNMLKVLHTLSKSKKNINLNANIKKSELIESLCKYFDPCKTNVLNYKRLRTKLEEISIESNKIITIIKIIQELLRLITLPEIDLDSKVDDLNICFKNDIKKLNIILNQSFLESNSNISDNKLIQLYYIKSNVSEFINSITKFARIINETLNILTMNLVNSESEHNWIKVASGRKIINNKRKSNDGSTVTLKNLIIKYNLLHKFLMKRMIGVINNYIANIYHGTYLKKKHGNKVLHINKTSSTKKYEKNIIINLKSFENITNNLNKKYRRKRENTDYDTLKYILVLMEYIIKQQNHLRNIVQDNDGIDLLVDVIKKAPDIKRVREFFLENIPERRKKEHLEESRHNVLDTMNSHVDYKHISKLKNNLHSVSNEEKAELKQFISTTNRVTTKVVSEILGYEKENWVETNNQINENNETNTSIEESSVINFEVLTTGVSEDVTENLNELLTSTSKIESLSTSVSTKRISKFKKNNNGIVKFANTILGKQKMDWFDDSYDLEIKETQFENVTSPTTEKQLEGALTEKKESNINNLSTISQENVDDETKQSNTIAAEELLNKKHLNLLNSLDYGLERSDLEDSDVNDVRYPSDLMF